jgi:hypothetical protein
MAEKYTMCIAQKGLGTSSSCLFSFDSVEFTPRFSKRASHEVEQSRRYREGYKPKKNSLTPKDRNPPIGTQSRRPSASRSLRIRFKSCWTTSRSCVLLSPLLLNSENSQGLEARTERGLFYA